MSPDGAAAERDSITAPPDDWPHTRRLMPWLIAGFLAIVFLIPVQATDLKVHLPFNSKLDRFALALMIGFLAVQALVRSASPRRPRPRITVVMAAVLVFGAIVLMSIVPNVDRIYRLGQLTFTEKALSQMLGYIAFFLIIATQVRRAEIPAYGRLVVALAIITALGTLYESRTGYNVFYDLGSKLLSPIAHVSASPTVIHPTYDRPRIVGPTKHGLALASMLAIALPFAVIRLREARTDGRRFLALLAIFILLAAALATQRKTAIVAPLGAFAVLVAYNRRLLRWAPLALIAAVPVIHFASPGALGTFDILANANSSDSTQQRVRDYSGVAPDILSHPLLGRGYGSLDTDNSRWYRIMDNEYLDELFQLGFIGLFAYLAMVAAPLITARRVVKRTRGDAAPVIAAAAGCAAFAVVSATFDAMAYPQAPYSFFFVAGLIAAAARERTETDERAVPPRAHVLATGRRLRREFLHAGDTSGITRPVAHRTARRPSADSSLDSPRSPAV
jgi:O-antigen ligase